MNQTHEKQNGTGTIQSPVRHHAAENAGPRSRRIRRAASVATAVGLALTVWGVARALGVELVSPEMGANPVAPIRAGHVITAAVMASAVGWAGLAALERLIPTRATTIWLVVAALVLVGSLGAPLTGAGITAATRGVLMALHLIVAGTLTVGLAAPVRRRRRPSHDTTTGETT